MAGPPRHAARMAMKTSPAPKATASLCATPAKIAAFPGQQLADRHQDKQRDEQRHKGQIEEGRTDRDFFARHGFERERIDRADENRGATGRQKQIVENERALARDRREETALLQPARAQRKERERSADEDHENEQG